MFKKLRKNKKGFTLIELIVVIAILAILAAIAIPRFVGTTDLAKDRANTANKATLTSAAQVYIAEKGAPTSAVTWNGAITGTGSGWQAYITTWPANPLGTGNYVVTIAATTGDVTVTP